MWSSVRNRGVRRSKCRALVRWLPCLDNNPADAPKRRFGLELSKIMAGNVGLYLRQHHGSLATKKQHLSALRRFFNLLVEQHICIINPALVTETERYEVVEGKTPEISAKQIKQLLRSLPDDSNVGVRDKPAISIMIHTAARAGAVARLKRGDYLGQLGERKLRFLKKGGKSREIAVRNDLEHCLETYLAMAALVAENAKTPLCLGCLPQRERIEVFSPLRKRYVPDGLRLSIKNVWY